MQQNEYNPSENEEKLENTENLEDNKEEITEEEEILKADDIVSADDRAALVKTFLIQAIIIVIAICIGRYGGNWIFEKIRYL